MPDEGFFEDDQLERYRDYLRLLAGSQMDSILRQRLEVSDLVQQSLIDAVSRQDQFRGTTEHEFLAWLKTILSNNLVDAIRYHGRAKRDAGRERSLHDEITESFRRIDAFVVDSAATPSQRAATNEELLRLPGALEALPDAQREAIVLHHLRGLKLAETATFMRRSESAVGGLLHRGLKRLHELLGE